jgi:hypothetical protein
MGLGVSFHRDSLRELKENQTRGPSETPGTATGTVALPMN